MKEIRIDPITKKRVILSTDRGKRPTDLKKETPKNNEKSSFCPFCFGNEDSTPKEIDRLGDNPWKVRVVPNKYSALEEGEYKKIEEDFFVKETGVGNHEVIIESTQHEDSFYNIQESKFKEIIEMYIKRYKDIVNKQDKKYISIFKNFGEKAGASLEHPHSQIVTLPFIPSNIKDQIENAKEYFIQTNECIYCEMIKKEIELGKRVIHLGEKFVVLAPFASNNQYEMMILPVNHEMDFSNMDDEEKRDLARILKDIFSKINEVLGEVPFNMYIDSVPEDNKIKEYYHWKIKIVPKISNYAGFELGTGIYINSISPEEVANLLYY